jgi:ABC-2 type transport system permease protein
MKSKWFIVFKKEFWHMVKSKSFILGTVLTPLIFILFIGIIYITQKKNMEKVREYHYIDETAQVVPLLESNLPATMKMIPWTGNKEEAITALRQKEIKNFLFFPGDLFENYSFEYYSETISDSQRISLIENVISRIIQIRKFAQRGLSETEINSLLASAKARTFEVTKEEGAKKKSAEVSFAIAYILVFLIYMSVLSWAPQMLRSTIEDKSNRVAEVLVSHVKPSGIMTGKLSGTAAAGVFQYLIWAAMALLGIVLLKQAVPGSQVVIKTLLGSLHPSVFIFFILYFLMGFLVFALIFGIIGAMFSNMQDAQNAMTPAILVCVLPMIFLFAVSQDPSSSFSVGVSLIPFLSSLMLMRIGISEVPAPQIALSMGLLLATIAIEIWLAGRIYRIGLLSYGKKPTWKELISWVKNG